MTAANLDLYLKPTDTAPPEPPASRENLKYELFRVITTGIVLPYSGTRRFSLPYATLALKKDRTYDARPAEDQDAWVDGDCYNEATWCKWAGVEA